MVEVWIVNPLGVRTLFSFNNRKSTIKILRNPASAVASTPAASGSKSLPPTNPASAACRPPEPPLLQKRTTHRASTQNPTTTHTPRPRAPAHAYLHTARDIQERRLLRSRSSSRTGQAREVDSRLG